MARTPSDFHFEAKTNAKSLSGAHSYAIDSTEDSTGFFEVLVRCGAKDTDAPHHFPGGEVMAQ
jgi:hypothetical protein